MYACFQNPDGSFGVDTVENLGNYPGARSKFVDESLKLVRVVANELSKQNQKPEKFCLCCDEQNCQECVCDNPECSNYVSAEIAEKAWNEIQ